MEKTTFVFELPERAKPYSTGIMREMSRKLCDSGREYYNWRVCVLQTLDDTWYLIATDEEEVGFHGLVCDFPGTDTAVFMITHGLHTHRQLKEFLDLLDGVKIY